MWIFKIPRAFVSSCMKVLARNPVDSPKCKAACVEITGKLCKCGNLQVCGPLEHEDFHICRSDQFHKYVFYVELHKYGFQLAWTDLHQTAWQHMTDRSSCNIRNSTVSSQLSHGDMTGSTHKCICSNTQGNMYACFCILRTILDMHKCRSRYFSTA